MKRATWPEIVENHHGDRKITTPIRRREMSRDRRRAAARPSPLLSRLHRPRTCDYVSFELDVSQGHKLYFLVDSGADISSVKSKKLLSTAQFEPRDQVRVKSIEGSIIETHDSLDARVREGEMSIPYHLQLVSKQVDLKGDGILGRDFLKAMRARICYREEVLIFQYKGVLIRKKLMSLPGAEPGAPRDRRVNNLTLPAGGRRTAGTRGHSRESRANARGVHGREPRQGR